MVKLHSEDALNFLINELAQIPEPVAGKPVRPQDRPHGSDVWIESVAAGYWAKAHQIALANLPQEDQEPYVRPFYDAAWELCRRGLLRPGAAFPSGQSATNQIGARTNSAPFFGDGYSLTTWGREWVIKSVAERGLMPTDPSRLTEVLLQFESQFGAGYAQRAGEAVSDYHSSNYLSACVMVGAAAESILLATAIAKSKDEGKVLAEYRSAGGRTRVARHIIGGATSAIGERFREALGILSYWRDDAGHGIASTISEIEAHEALSRLLRLAQFTSDNWAKLTA